jgi:hypothetical protein
VKRKPLIVYTDPPWAISPEGIVDPSLAIVERAVLGDKFDMRIAPVIEGRYAKGQQLYEAVHEADALALIILSPIY